jgi:hypothetical protein
MLSPALATQPPIPVDYFHSAADRSGYRPCDLVLDGKDVEERAVVTLGPQLVARRGIDELRIDPDPVAVLTDATFDDISNTQILCDPLHRDRLAPKGERRLPRNDEQ